MTTKKPFKISKQLVWKSYQLVKAKGGASGIDEESIEDFEKNGSVANFGFVKVLPIFGIF